MDDDELSKRDMRKVHSSMSFLVWHKEYLEQKVEEAKKNGYKESQANVLRKIIDYYIENNEEK
jgi:hypothetical protein